MDAQLGGFLPEPVLRVGGPKPTSTDYHLYLARGKNQGRGVTGSRQPPERKPASSKESDMTDRHQRTSSFVDTHKHPTGKDLVPSPHHQLEHTRKLL